jgi:hypothetical protein
VRQRADLRRPAGPLGVLHARHLRRHLLRHGPGLRRELRRIARLLAERLRGRSLQERPVVRRTPRRHRRLPLVLRFYRIEGLACWSIGSSAPAPSSNRKTLTGRRFWGRGPKNQPRTKRAPLPRSLGRRLTAKVAGGSATMLQPARRSQTQLSANQTSDSLRAPTPKPPSIRVIDGARPQQPKILGEAARQGNRYHGSAEHEQNPVIPSRLPLE